MTQTSAPKGMRHARCTECTGDSRANMSKLKAWHPLGTAAQHGHEGCTLGVCARSLGTLGREDMIASIMEKLKEANAFGKPMVFCTHGAHGAVRSKHFRSQSFVSSSSRARAHSPVWLAIEGMHIYVLGS